MHLPPADAVQGRARDMRRLLTLPMVLVFRCRIGDARGGWRSLSMAADITVRSVLIKKPE